MANRYAIPVDIDNLEQDLNIHDEVVLSFGTGEDIKIMNRSTALSANAEISGFIDAGTASHPGVTANSLILSNTTSNGDVMFAINDGGTAKGLLKINGTDGTVDVHANLLPTADDTYDLGTSTKAWKDLFLEGNITFSDAATISTTAGDITLNAGGGGVVVNPTVSTTSGITQLQVRGDITTTDGSSNQRYIGAGSGFGGSVVINSGNTHGKVSTVELYEPGITETSGAVTSAQTLYIGDAPTEGATNYALYVDAGASRFDGAISLGTDHGDDGQQLTSGGDDAACDWTAASSLREHKDISGVADPSDALQAMLGSTAYHFRYKEKHGTGDSKTEYVGVMADDAPWAMHYKGRIVNPVNTLGYTVLAVQALNDKIEKLEAQLRGV